MKCEKHTNFKGELGCPVCWLEERERLQTENKRLNTIIDNRAEDLEVKAKYDKLKIDLENYSLLEECSPPDWPRKDFVKHLFQLWEDQHD